MFLSVPSFAAGFASGFGAGVLTRELVRISNAALRPVAKAVIKGGMMAYDKSREAMAVTGETLEDLVAEARADIHPAASTNSSASGGESGVASQTSSAAAHTSATPVAGQA